MDTTTTTTPIALAVAELDALRDLLFVPPVDREAGTVDAAALSLSLANEARRLLRQAEERIADVLPALDAAEYQRLANGDHAIAAEVERFRDSRWSMVDVTELKGSGDDDEDGETWDVKRGSSRFEVRNVQRFEVRTSARFEVRTSARFEVRHRGAGIYGVVDTRNEDAPVFLDGGADMGRELAQAEADRLNAQPGNTTAEIIDHDSDGDAIDLDDHEDSVRAALLLDDSDGDSPHELPDTLTGAQADAIASALNAEESDADRWIVVDTENGDARADDCEEVPRYDTEDETDADEAADNGNREDYRNGACGWPFAWNTAAAIDERDADDFAAAGFVVAEHTPSGQWYAGIDGGGYSFLDAHWVPLFLRFRLHGRYSPPCIYASTDKGLRRVVLEHPKAEASTSTPTGDGPTVAP